MDKLSHAVYKQLFAEGLSSKTFALIAVTAVIGRLIYQYMANQDDVSKLPLINGRKPWTFSITAQKMNFIQNSRSLVDQGLETAGKAFQLQTDDGIQLILSADYANQIKDHPDLNFEEITKSDFHVGIPGFDAFTQSVSKDHIFHKTIELLTRKIPVLSEALSQEATNALQSLWTDSSEWHDVLLFNTAFETVAQLSSRAFLGPELCRSKEWVPCVQAYGTLSITAAQDLRLWPRPLRSIVHWFLPSCRQLRTAINKSRELVNPVLKQRQQDQEARIRQGLKPIEFTDALEWIQQVAGGRPFDAVAIQLMMAMTASFTTSNALTQVIYDLCDQPQLVEDLRKEIISVLTQNQESSPGDQWSKSSMYKLKLMDSVMKESQRLNPPTVTSMHRMATKDTILPDGTRMSKGRKLMVTTHLSRDSSIFPDPDKFNGYRFLQLRDAESSAKHQFVTTSPGTMAFGHGHLACPGRFFAAHEIKIVLCHILLKYDIKLATDTRPEMITFGLLHISDTTGHITVRRRQEEVLLM